MSTGLPFVFHRQQLRPGDEIVVPQIVMQQLVVPQPLAGAKIEREQRVAEQVVAFPIAAPQIERRRAEREIPDAALLVDRQTRPRCWRRRPSSTRRAATCRSRIRPAEESCGTSTRACRSARRTRGCLRAASCTLRRAPSPGREDSRTPVRAIPIARRRSAAGVRPRPFAQVHEAVHAEARDRFSRSAHRAAAGSCATQK